MLLRRAIVSISGALAVASSYSRMAKAQGTDTIDLERDWKFLSGSPSSGGSAVTGSGPARSEEVAKAFRLLYNAPRGKEPAEVAKYFEGFRASEKPTKEGYYWNEEWPTDRPNPVVVGFFSMTNTLPNKGDETPWCAAFVNFCLAVAGRPIEWSAWALDFVNYGKPTTDPNVGDIVVFSRPGGGHVGFYLGRYKDGTGKDIGTLVLGGNQGGGSPGSKGAVSVGKVAFASSYEIKGYRMIPTAS
jgi:uncharacterized protein (TIGR02594 family)